MAMSLDEYRYVTPTVASTDPRMQRAIGGWLGTYEVCWMLQQNWNSSFSGAVPLSAREDQPEYGKQAAPSPAHLARALERTAKALNETATPYVLAGGIALSYYRHERATREVDFFVFRDPKELEPLREKLAWYDVRPHREEGPGFLQPEGLFWFEPLQMGFADAPPVNVDLLVSAHEFMAILHATGCESNFAGERVRVIGLEGYIILKLRAFRRRDQADLEALWAFNRDRVDQTTLNAWLKRFELEARFEQIKRWVDESDGRRLG
ncbi:MAG: nucleotidyl transferase AbiEii/AbiGii toxin family protein [Planctomycetes bacterium]|nr:nucleotidyl transferase AbiEii/AbiGii toxin family protein [Planctomycetota bacterium]